MPPNKCMTAVSPFLEYDTIKTVHIRSKKVRVRCFRFLNDPQVGLMFRLLQLGILGYIIGYVIVYKKGYQELDQAVSSVVTKIDYTIPAQENNAFFLATNFVEVPNQMQDAGGWNEDPRGDKIGTNKCSTHMLQVWNCSSDDNCPRYSISRNGVLTGQCNTTIGLCRIFGWGPIELDATDEAAQTIPNATNLLLAVVNFTVNIKNNIYFPKFQTKFSNTGNKVVSPSYFTTCTWNPTTDPNCPIFRVNDLITAAGITTYLQKEVAIGAVIAIGIQYNCDLDQDSSSCTPSFTVTRTDNSIGSSPGFNFRHAYYTRDLASGILRRDLYKVYGLRFVFVVSGTAGRFSIIPLLVAFGSGLGLLGLATVIADLLVTKVLEKRSYYSSHKYEFVDDEDDFSEFHSKREERVPLVAAEAK